mmetsp:Transcript_29855/g.86605  ORF Transcript_29855/g.86605 Transcript_29855/m.86605 type:complete len:212 (-) Transcript_29855:1729-2364(-)
MTTRASPSSGCSSSLTRRRDGWRTCRNWASRPSTLDHSSSPPRTDTTPSTMAWLTVVWAPTTPCVVWFVSSSVTTSVWSSMASSTTWARSSSPCRTSSRSARAPSTRPGSTASSSAPTARSTTTVGAASNSSRSSISRSLLSPNTYSTRFGIGLSISSWMGCVWMRPTVWTWPSCAHCGSTATHSNGPSGSWERSSTATTTGGPTRTRFIR